MAKPMLGEMLVQNGAITQEQLNRALEIQKSEGGLIGIILISQGVITEQTLVEYLSLQAKIVTTSE